MEREEEIETEAEDDEEYDPLVDRRRRHNAVERTRDRARAAQRRVRQRLNEIDYHNVARQVDLDQFDEKAFSKRCEDGTIELHKAHSAYCGPMNQVCYYCGARYFTHELNSEGKYTKCCREGRINLAPLSAPTPVVAECLAAHTERGKMFHRKSGIYNSQLSLSSINANFDDKAGYSAVSIMGRIYSKLGPVHTDEPAFMSNYFHDGTATVTNNKLSKAEAALLLELRSEMLYHSPFLASIKMHEDVYGEFTELPLFRLKFSDAAHNRQGHKGIYGAPTVSIPEIGVVLGHDDAPAHRSVSIAYHDGTLRTIRSDNEFYDSLGYTLFHMHGDVGWHRDLKDATGRKVSALDYYAYRAHCRDEYDREINGMNDVLLSGGKLTLQFFCDMVAKIEEERLNFLRSEKGQKKIHAELYQGLADAVAEGRSETVGRKIILPATFPGSPRQFIRSYQDAMAIVRKLGKPTYFITFTCNPKWREIVENLQPGEQSWERADLEVRVFQMKLKMLLDDLKKKHVLGKVKGDIHVIEFQKRGLPHAHILLIMKDDEKPRTAVDFDKIASAEFPNKEINPKLFQTISTCMFHHPCGDHNEDAVCMKEGLCSKCFPKDYRKETVLDENEFYPLYRRRSISDGGHFAMWKDKVVDNSWVVAYNPYLSLKYDAHINVEICASLTSVKYLYKYVYKGPDRVAYTVISDAPQESRNEVEKYLDARYLTSSEAFWKLFRFGMSANNPTVYRLPTHDENQQRVFYEPGDEVDALRRSRDTMLTAFFDICRQEATRPPTILERTDARKVVHPLAKDILYCDFPSHFVWSKKMWRRRTKHTSEEVIGRVNFVPFSEGEAYYIRVLLHHVKGPTCWEDLRTVEGVIYNTYRDACAARGLLADDAEWRSLFNEMAQMCSPQSMRDTFISILLFETPSDPTALWEEFKNHFCEDFTRARNRREAATRSMVVRHGTEEDYNETLFYLNAAIDDITNGKQTVETFGLPGVQWNLPIYQPDPDTEYFDSDELAADVGRCIAMFNREQRIFYDVVLDSVLNRKGKLYFLDGPGGTGKSFVFNTILKQMKLLNIRAIPTAASGMTSIILLGGRTHHNGYGGPFHCFHDSQCSMTLKSLQGQRIRDAELLLFDEAPMTNKDVLHAIDRLLKELTGDDRWMGGKTVVFGGDWRQVLPVIPRGDHAQILQKLLLRSPMWREVDRHELIVNERVKRGGGNASFAKYVLEVGSGKQLCSDHLLPRSGSSTSKMIKIPDQIVLDSQDPFQLLDWVYPNLRNEHTHRSKACILTTKNVFVDDLNNKAINVKPGDLIHKLSADTTQDRNSFMPTEFLNSLTPSGCPPHDLALKVGAPVMLLRNLNPRKGLCNGTRMIVKRIGFHFIECVIQEGVHAGEVVAIHRITFKVEGDVSLGFEMTRRQFPLRLNYAMTINKAQGQTLERVGIFLPEPCFSHGQLYVALSRCGNSENVKMLIHDVPKLQGKFEGLHGTFTRNIVYHEVLS